MKMTTVVGVANLLVRGIQSNYRFKQHVREIRKMSSMFAELAYTREGDFSTRSEKKRANADADRLNMIAEVLNDVADVYCKKLAG